MLRASPRRHLDRRFELGLGARGRARRGTGAARRGRDRRRRSRWTGDDRRGTPASTASPPSARLKERFGVATLDGFGRFDRAALAPQAACSPISTRSAREALAVPAAAGRRAPAPIIWRSTPRRRESLELIRSASGDARRQPARRRRPHRHRRRRAAARRRSRRAAARSGARSRRGSIWSPGSPTMAGCARACARRLRALPDIGRALGRLVAGRGGPRDLGQLRDGLNEARAAARSARPARRSARAARGAAAGSGRPWRADRPAQPRAGAGAADRRRAGRLYRRGLRRRAGRPARDRRRRASRDRRAGSALSRSETGIASLKIRHNGVLGYHIEVPARQRRQADGRRLRLHPSPDAGRGGALQRSRPARAGVAGRPGRRSCARGRGRASRGTDRGGAEPRGADRRRRRRLARLDVAAALAERAVEGGWTRPAFDEAPASRSKAAAIRWWKRPCAAGGRTLRRQRSAA